MAAADFFDFRIRGRGAHGAMPHMGVDPVTASAAAPWLQPGLPLKWSPLKGGLGPNTPWKINMEPTNQPFRKENDLPNLHDYVPS